MDTAEKTLISIYEYYTGNTAIAGNTSVKSTLGVAYSNNKTPLLLSAFNADDRITEIKLLDEKSERVGKVLTITNVDELWKITKPMLFMFVDKEYGFDEVIPLLRDRASTLGARSKNIVFVIRGKCVDDKKFSCTQIPNTDLVAWYIAEKKAPMQIATVVAKHSVGNVEQVQSIIIESPTTVWTDAITKNNSWLLDKTMLIERKAPTTWSVETEWYDSLRKFIKDVVGPIVKNIDIDKYVSDLAMAYWVRAFTHVSFNYDMNYEALEKLGDGMLSGAFTDYLLRVDPMWSAEELTHLGQRYMSKPVQGKIGYLLSLQSMVRIRKKLIDTSIIEDLFESFAGALYRVGDMVTPGSGFSHVFNFVYLVFNSIDVFKLDASPPDKTAVQQTFSMLGWGDVVEDVRPIQDIGGVVKYSARLMLSAAAKRALVADGKLTARDNDMLAESVANTRNNALYSAYIKSNDRFVSMGIDQNYRKLHSAANKIKKYIPEDVRNALAEKVKALGFNYFTFEERIESEGKGYRQIIGFKTQDKNRNQREVAGSILAHALIDGTNTHESINKLVVDVMRLK